MGFVFVRQGGKVFGPFADDRLRAAIAAGTFDATAEFAAQWNGPWGPLSKVRSQGTSTSAQPSTSSPTTVREATQASTAQTPPQLPALPDDADDDDDLPFFQASPPSRAPAAVARLSRDGDDEDDGKFFRNLSQAARRSAATRKTELPISLPLAISVGGGVLAAGAVLIAAIVWYGGRVPDVPSADSPPGMFDARTNRDPNFARGPASRPVGPSSTRTSRPSAAEKPTSARPTAVSQGAAGVRAGEPQPSAPLPKEAEEAVNALRALRASIEIGISFEQYTAKLQSLLPQVKLFLESRESEQVPQLKTLLANATDCYVAVKQVWNDSIFASSPVAKAEASALLGETRTKLWDMAEENVRLAYDLTSPEPGVRSGGLQRAASEAASLRPGPVLEAARRTFAERRAAETAAAAAPAAAPAPAPAAPRPPPKSTFNSQNIDVRALRAMAEALKKGDLAEDDAEIVEQVLSLTRAREWQTQRGDKSWGDAITIRPDTVRLITKKGDGTIPRERLSEAGQKVLERIAELAEKLHNLSERPAVPAAP